MEIRSDMICRVRFWQEINRKNKGKIKRKKFLKKFRKTLAENVFLCYNAITDGKRFLTWGSQKSNKQKQSKNSKTI